jgi:hypothetical protein
MARRHGLRLERSRTRDPLAISYGTYHLVDSHKNLVLWGDQDAYGLSLDEIEIALRDGEQSRSVMARFQASKT